MSITERLGRMVAWLRAGYPDGVPEGDYVALLGVLHRGLTEVEVESIAGELAEQSKPGESISEDRIRQIIREQIYETASDEDVARVSERLAAGGWDDSPTAGDAPDA